MSEKKNIERLFQEKFKDFEATPSQEVWDGIEAALQKKKKRRVIPLWFRLSGAAALLLVGALIGYEFTNDAPTNNNQNPVVNQEDSNPGKNLVPTKNPIQNNQVVTETGDSNINESQNSASSENASNENNLNATESSVLPNNGSKNNAIASQENTEINTSQKSDKATNNTAFGNKKNGIATSLKNKKNAGNASEISTNNDALANSDKAQVPNRSTKNSLATHSNTNKNSAIIQGNSAMATTSGTKNIRQEKTAVSDNKTAIIKDLNTEIAFDKKSIDEQKKDSTAVATVVPNALEELLKQQEKEKELVTESKVDRWRITSNVAPIYFSSASNGSPISQDLSDNNKSYDKNISYGVGVNYALSKKWSVRGGLNKLTLGYNTDNIVYYAGLPGDMARNSHAFQATGSKIIIEDNSAANVLSFDNIPGKNNGYLNQTMGYLEVPVELSYKLLDRKFGIELIGGMSTMFLNENNLSVISGEFVTSAGKAENLNDISFTTNIGLGFKYNFWKSFQANIEPKFKYQLNTFSENDGGFKPYFIGIYSGLSFSF